MQNFQGVSFIWTGTYREIFKPAWVYLEREFRGLPWRTVFDKINGKVFNVDKNPKYDRYQRRLASVFYKFFNKENLLVLIL